MMKYIYFEEYTIRDKHGYKSRKIQNENILLFKPNTNSNGFYWVYNNNEHITNWIDLEKYTFGINATMDEKVNRVINKLKPQYRAHIIEDLI